MLELLYRIPYWRSLYLRNFEILRTQELMEQKKNRKKRITRQGTRMRMNKLAYNVKRRALLEK